jgi:hypothetical protein
VEVLLSIGCSAFDHCSAVNDANKLLECSKLDMVECLCETICSVIMSADPVKLDCPFVDLLLDVALAYIDMLGTPT